MNKVVLMGRLTRDPEVRYSQGENALAIARYTLAVDLSVMENRGQILLTVLCLARVLNLQNVISVRECA